jgi:hypothetical protein
LANKFFIADEVQEEDGCGEHIDSHANFSDALDASLIVPFFGWE